MECKHCNRMVPSYDYDENGNRKFVLCRDLQSWEREQRADDFRAKVRELAADGVTFPGAWRFSFDDDDGADKQVGDICRRYVDQWEEMRKNNIGVLLFGSVGRGKTFFASCIGRALLNRCVSVAYTSVPRLLALLQGTRDRVALIDGLRRYELLILDDVGAERESSYASEQLYAVVDSRARSGLPLIATTNMTLDEMKNPKTEAEARIYDRLLSMCAVRIPMTGPSRRTQQAEQRRELARALLLEGGDRE